MAKSSRKPARLPLWKHKATGQWCRKIGGKFFYFGTDLEAAIEEWLRDKDYLLAGKSPPPRPEDNPASIAVICDAFMEFKEGRLKSGELQKRSFDRYHATCKYLVAKLGRHTLATQLTPMDFQRLRAKMAKHWGPVGLGNEIQIIRSIFKYAFDMELIERPVKYGQGFAKPSKRTLRQVRVEKGNRLVSPADLHKLLKHAGPQMKAMVLLGLNAGLGNTDLALLPIKAIDFKRKWLSYPRPKTAIVREVPLWDRTIKALRAAIDARPAEQSAEAAGLVFIGPRGQTYIGGHKGYRVHQEFQRVTIKAGVDRNFYDLRRSFQTIGEEAGDAVAVAAVMGHAPRSDDMASVYRQRVSTERLLAVVQRVEEYYFPKATVKAS